MPEFTVYIDDGDDAAIAQRNLERSRAEIVWPLAGDAEDGWQVIVRANSSEDLVAMLGFEIDYEWDESEAD